MEFWGQDLWRNNYTATNMYRKKKSKTFCDALGVVLMVSKNFGEKSSARVLYVLNLVFSHRVKDFILPTFLKLSMSNYIKTICLPISAMRNNMCYTWSARELGTAKPLLFGIDSLLLREGQWRWHGCLHKETQKYSLQTANLQRTWWKDF